VRTSHGSAKFIRPRLRKPNENDRALAHKYLEDWLEKNARSDGPNPITSCVLGATPHGNRLSAAWRAIDSNLLDAYTKFQMMLSRSNLCRSSAPQTASLALTLASSLGTPPLPPISALRRIYRLLPLSPTGLAHISASPGAARGHS